MDYLENYYDWVEFISKYSPDEETKVGAILIDKKTKEVKEMAYNGFVFGANNHNIPCRRPNKYKYMIHAEVNLICNAIRNGHSTKNCIVFVSHSPCVNCARVLYQSGITTIYFPNENWRKETEELGIALDLTARCIKINDRFSKLKLSPVK